MKNTMSAIKYKLTQYFPKLSRFYKRCKYAFVNGKNHIDPFASFDMSNKYQGKIFCIGSGKTGTTSLEQALINFGYDLGPQARAEMLTSECYNRDFDRLIRFCKLHEAFQDAPFCWSDYYKVLDQAFPDSKFILTIRDSGEQWFNSLTNFHGKNFSSSSSLPSVEDLKNSKYGYLGMAYDNYVCFYNYPQTPLYDKDAYIKIYEDRNNEIIEYFKDRPDQLLILNVSDETAYTDLGRFLNIKIPAGRKFPWYNKT